MASVLGRLVMRMARRFGRPLLLVLPPQVGFLLSLVPDPILTRYAPIKIVIEPNNTCNLSCPLCAVNTTMERPRGQMDFAHFKQVVDTLPSTVTELFLYNWGESFLNKEIFAMIRYAHGKGFRTQISTNATTLEKHADAILDSGLSELIVAMDGASKETQEKYRVGSDFERVKNGIRHICQRKAEKGASTNIVLQFIPFKHNQHELPEMVRLAKELGVDHLVFKKASIISYKNDEKYRVQLGLDWLPDDPKGRVLHFVNDDAPLNFQKQVCYWAWQSNVLWNGDVTSCCMDSEGVNVVGNVFKHPRGFEGVYRSPSYVKMRKQILRRETPICHGCPLNAKMHNQIF